MVKKFNYFKKITFWKKKYLNLGKLIVRKFNIIFLFIKIVSFSKKSTLKNFLGVWNFELFFNVFQMFSVELWKLKYKPNIEIRSFISIILIFLMSDELLFLENKNFLSMYLFFWIRIFFEFFSEHFIILNKIFFFLKYFPRKFMAFLKNSVKNLCFNNLQLKLKVEISKFLFIKLNTSDLKKKFNWLNFKRIVLYIKFIIFQFLLNL